MKRVFLLVTAFVLVFTLSACNEQKTLTCVDYEDNVILKAVYDKNELTEWTEDGVSLEGEELTALNEGLWEIFDGSGHYELMEKVRLSHDNNAEYDSDNAEDSEVPEEDRLTEEQVVTCEIK